MGVWQPLRRRSRLEEPQVDLLEAGRDITWLLDHWLGQGQHRREDSLEDRRGGWEDSREQQEVGWEEEQVYWEAREVCWEVEVGAGEEWEPRRLLEVAEGWEEVWVVLPGWEEEIGGPTWSRWWVGNTSQAPGDKYPREHPSPGP